MEVICENCNARLNIPEDKVPTNRHVAIKCPKCRNRIIIQTDEREPEKAPAPAEDVAGLESYLSRHETVLDTFEEGKKPALVMAGQRSWSDALKTASESLGYQCLEAQSSKEAIDRLRFHHFDLLLLADGFDGHSASQSPVLGYINNQSMSIRRKMFLVIVGDSFTTMDNLAAYSLSANLVLNEKDIDKLAVILKTSIAENEKFYKIFIDTLKETGGL
ncbi:MAG TPA: hypothetical protein ENN79_11680 [Desulfobacteraceae bacterium]|nr:hypothetical protein [Desulfobacteraceae bacterium]